jgi:hypothetical protein
MIGNYNVDMSPIAQGLNMRAANIEAERKRQSELEIKKLVAKSIPSLREGSPMRQLFEADPQTGAFLAKALNIPLNNLDDMEQFSQNVRTMAGIAPKDPAGAAAIAQKLRDDRAQIGLDTSMYDKFLQTYQENPEVAIRALNQMDSTLNKDLIEAQELEQRKMNLQERGLDIQEKRIDADMQQGGASSYYQPIQTADGLYAFNARTGQVEQALTPSGGAITPAQVDVGLQGQLAGAKTGASEREKVAIDKEKAIASSDKLQVGIDEARKLIPLATGSMMGAARDATLGAAGIATDKSKAASQLETLAGWMVANVPRMEGPQSNFDVENYKTMAAKVGNRSSPIEERIAALDTLEMLHAKYRGINSPKGSEQQQGRDAPKLTGQDKQAYDWAVSNPNDPRSQAILQRLGVQ